MPIRAGRFSDLVELVAWLVHLRRKPRAGILLSVDPQPVSAG